MKVYENGCLMGNEDWILPDLEWVYGGPCVHVDVFSFRTRREITYPVRRLLASERLCSMGITRCRTSNANCLAQGNFTVTTMGDHYRYV
jgi:hypothetical protein